MGTECFNAKLFMALQGFILLHIGELVPVWHTLEFVLLVPSALIFTSLPLRSQWEHCERGIAGEQRNRYVVWLSRLWIDVKRLAMRDGLWHMI